MESGLKWVTYVSDGWITVSPSSGIGNTSNVIISINDDWAGQDTISGTVTFRCVDCKSSEVKEKVINVCRCSCNCNDIIITSSMTMCSCDDFTIISDFPNDWGWNETSAKNVIFSSNACVKNVSAVSSNEWFTTNIEESAISITPHGENKTESPKTAKITINYISNGVACEREFTVKQNEMDMNICNCDNILITEA